MARLPSVPRLHGSVTPSSFCIVAVLTGFHFLFNSSFNADLGLSSCTLSIAMRRNSSFGEGNVAEGFSIEFIMLGPCKQVEWCGCNFVARCTSLLVDKRQEKTGAFLVWKTNMRQWVVLVSTAGLRLILYFRMEDLAVHRLVCPLFAPRPSPLTISSSID